MVPRTANSDIMDMTGHAVLVRVLSTMWELPFAGVKEMDGLAIWRIRPDDTKVKVPYGTDQLLLIPLMGEVSVTTLGSDGEPHDVRLGEQATLLRRNADTDEVSLKGESAILVMYRLRQPKTVENLSKAKRAGLYPHVPSATQQVKTGTPKSTRSGPMRVADIERWRIRRSRGGPGARAVLVCTRARRAHAPTEVRTELS